MSLPLFKRIVERIESWLSMVNIPLVLPLLFLFDIP